jgi:hypothetical protein
MNDVTPKRTARQSERGKISPDEALPTAAAPTIVPQAPTVAEVVVPRPVAVAEPAPQVVSAPAKPPADSVDQSWTRFVEAQAVLARGFEEIAVELTGMTRSSIASVMDAAVALVGARTFSEAVDIHAGLARRGVDAMIEGSARLSEIGVKAISESGRPVLSRLSLTWSGVGPG